MPAARLPGPPPKALLPSQVLIALGVAIGGPASLPLIGVSVLWMALVAVAISTVSGIIQAALYHYAADEEVASRHLDSQALAAAFRPRSRRFGL